MLQCVPSYFGRKNIVEINSSVSCAAGIMTPSSEKFINFSVDNLILITVKDTRSVIMLRGCNTVFKLNSNFSNNWKNSRVSRYCFPLRQKFF